MWIIEYLRSKCLPAAEQAAINHNFSKKIFISRKDTLLRNMINEDEIFELFEAYGFKRYCLGQMSIIEQVLLFKNAETIVAAHGSGLTHLIFCNPGTQLIEIFQARSDCSYWYLSQTLGLRYHYILTMPFAFDCFAPDNTTVPIPLIQDFIEKNTLLFQ
jgi:capsular polysaccharide biosynthesis protein